ncbi:MAG: hypothetical protein CK536_08105 [Synechococcus sp. Baikal-G1]|nr:MAG: hypothetical protein CK536_08105 [Synechococcus sp. Baikal-G1]
MEPTSPPWLPPGAPETQPEGMLRISDGQSFQVIWPVHLAGWLALGWQLDWPQPAGAGPAPGLEAVGPLVFPVITALLGGPFHARAEKPYRAVLQGSGFTPDLSLKITASTGETLSPTDLTYANATEMALSLDSRLLQVACHLTVVAAIGSLASLPFQVQLLEPADAPVPATPADLDGMTKAELLAFARKTYGQKLDSSLSKAKVLAAAKALGRGPEAEAGPGSVIGLDGAQTGLGQDQDPQPGWLLGDDQDAEEPEAVPGVPTDLLI